MRLDLPLHCHRGLDLAGMVSVCPDRAAARHGLQCTIFKAEADTIWNISCLVSFSLFYALFAVSRAFCVVFFVLFPLESWCSCNLPAWLWNESGPQGQLQFTLRTRCV
ncbi:hypothetical protein SEVIR_3G064800v4 [Setaria viridis]|uniref:Uncharacterized protein n=1 Tax=Setaria viridis TaxID=4556 RepID=A0A4U6VA78_SETVI|nr:hypothetical protein SEVIR_3G064800v2 [Setaria viridis]